jgi:hypothetical protein
MNKEFCSYEQALELKSLGFNEPCFMQWTYQPELIFCVSSWGHIKVKTNEESHSDSGGDCISAPLKSQAFRWFREKHKLYHTINMFGDWDKPQYSYLVSGRTMNNPAHMWHFEDKDSHEEAELECLDKLIEIVKNK